MRIHLLSDLHNEFQPFTPVPTDADLVILAGDIHTKARGVAWAQEAFVGKKVVYVCGNHEYYGGHLTHTLEKMKALCSEDVQVLEQDVAIVEGVRILGATAWTDYRSTGIPEASQRYALDRLNDFRYIRCDNYRRARISDFTTRSEATYAWLAEQLATPFDGPTVVVTHHAPSLTSVTYNPTLDYSLYPAYANSWESLMSEHVALWVHGHSHHFADYCVGGTRVVCNPRGYPGQETHFDPGLIIDL